MQLLFIVFLIVIQKNQRDNSYIPDEKTVLWIVVASILLN